MKTDSVDARTLAHLLRTDLLPGAYVAPRDLCDLCDLLRHRVVLTRMRSALKNRVHALLARRGIQHGHGDLFGKGGRRYLAEVPGREPARRRLGSLLSLIGDFDGEIEQAKREIDALARDDPGVDVLCQLRGIGRYTAMLVIAEVGEIERFRSARHPLLPGRSHPHRPLLRRPRPARAHLPARLAAHPLGHGRGRAESRHRRAAARRLPADRQAPRPHHRQGSPSPAACSPSAPTGYATARSAASPIRGRRARLPSRQRHERPSTT